MGCIFLLASTKVVQIPSPIAQSASLQDPKERRIFTISSTNTRNTKCYAIQADSAHAVQAWVEALQGLIKNKPKRKSFPVDEIFSVLSDREIAASNVLHQNSGCSLEKKMTAGRELVACRHLQNTLVVGQQKIATQRDSETVEFFDGSINLDVVFVALAEREMEATRILVKPSSPEQQAQAKQALTSCRELQEKLVKEQHEIAQRPTASPMVIKGSVKEGFLLKKGRKLGKLSVRYFVSHPTHRITYFSFGRDAKLAKRRELRLNRTTVMVLDQKDPSTFTLYPPGLGSKGCRLKSSNPEEAKTWVKAITALVVEAGYHKAAARKRVSILLATQAPR